MLPLPLPLPPWKAFAWRQRYTHNAICVFICICRCCVLRAHWCVQVSGLEREAAAGSGLLPQAAENDDDGDQVERLLFTLAGLDSELLSLQSVVARRALYGAAAQHEGYQSPLRVSAFSVKARKCVDDVSDHPCEDTGSAPSHSSSPEPLYAL